MRIFVDANLLFFAAKSDGAIRQLLQLLRRAGHKLVVDGYVLEEARRNLAHKFPAGVQVLEALVPTLDLVGTHPDNLALASKLPLPDKDKPVLLAAIAARCQALVTGDQTHFGPLFGQRVGGVDIHSPRTLAEQILAGPRTRK
jgi:predicted nucleic acid-binding protein